MATIRAASWDAVQEVRARIDGEVARCETLAAAAQVFTTAFTTAFETVALARLFLVAPLEQLPGPEQEWAESFAEREQRRLPLSPLTPVLTLLGTSGTEPAWNDRVTSTGHRAIPLVDRSLVDGAPMIAALLSSLHLVEPTVNDASGIQLRPMSGGLNSRFVVMDARIDRDSQGRRIIAATDFVAKHAIRTVFGMGGTYVRGWTAVAIVFTRELLDLPLIERFPSFIGTFKLKTAELVERGHIF